MTQDRPEWATPEVVNLLKGAGFAALASKVADIGASDYEVEVALRVILLHRRIPYVPLSMSAHSDAERYRSSCGIGHDVALDNPEVARFQESLPDDVVMFHVHPEPEPLDAELGPGWVIVVQADRFGFFLEEHYTLVRTD